LQGTTSPKSLLKYY